MSGCNGGIGCRQNSEAITPPSTIAALHDRQPCSCRRELSAWTIQNALRSPSPALAAGASERTVKYWFQGKRGPSGEHLVSLARHSEAVLIVLLALADRVVLEDGKE